MSRPSGSVNPMAIKRIKKEMTDIAKEDLGNITMVPSEADMFYWKATIPGPEGSPYEGGEFEVEIKLPKDYPFSPPALRFVTRVYHCNVNPQGQICLDLLKHAWSPALSLYKVILSLSSLLTDPNPKDPLVPSIAHQYLKNRAEHDATAREFVQKYALPKHRNEDISEAPKPAPVRPGISRTATGSSTSSRARPSPQPPTVPSTIPARRSARSNEVIDLRESSDDEAVETATRPVKRLRKANGEAQPTSGTSSRPEGHPSSDVIIID